MRSAHRKRRGSGRGSGEPPGGASPPLQAGPYLPPLPPCRGDLLRSRDGCAMGFSPIHPAGRICGINSLPGGNPSRPNTSPGRSTCHPHRGALHR
mgnify:FL=1